MRASTLSRILVLALCLVEAAHAQQESAESAWVADGPVYAITNSSAVTFIGGDFDRVGAYTGRGVPVLVNDGKAAATYPLVNGEVLAAASDGAGGWYIGGSFTRVGGLARNYAARVMSNGSVDTAWNPNANAVVRALAVGSGKVFVGGDFSTIGGASRSRLASLDATSGAAAAGWDPSPNGVVRALALNSSVLYAGGDFTVVYGLGRSKLAAIDVPSGVPAPSWNPGGTLGIDGAVNALAVIGGSVAAGGAFTSVDGSARGYAVAVTSEGVVTAWNPQFNGVVRALAFAGGKVYAGGDFTTVNGGTPRSRLAAVSSVNGAEAFWSPDPDGTTVSALSVQGSTVFVGGDFSFIGNTVRNRVAAVDLVISSATGWNPNVDGAVKALASNGAVVYVGGSFSNVGGMDTHANIAAVETATGKVLPWGPDASAAVRALVLGANGLYVGGDFATVGGQARNYIAAVDTHTGVPTAWNPNADAAVLALAARGSLVYAGGSFTSIGGSARNRLAALDATLGTASAWNPDVNGTVRALALGDNVLYAGGDFTTVNGGTGRTRAAALALATGLASAWNPDANGTVRALALSTTAVYAGGDFTSIGGAARNYAAALDAAGAASAWSPNPNGAVHSLVVEGASVFLGGDFTTAGGQVRNRLAAVDAGSGLAGAWNPDADATVRVLALRDFRLHAGGDFTQVGGGKNPRYGRFLLQAAAASAPVSFVGTVVSSTSIVWSWTPSTDSQGYAVLTGADAGVSGALSTSAWSYAESGLAPNASVTRKVRVVNELGNAVSPPASLYTLSAVPATVSFTAVSRSSLTLSWDANNNPGGTRYTIEMSSSSDFGGVISTAAPLSEGLTSQSKTLVNLRAGATYYLRVLSWNASDVPSSGFSPVVSTVTMAIGGVSTEPVTNAVDETVLAGDGQTTVEIPAGTVYPGELTSGSIAVGTAPLAGTLTASATSLVTANTSLGPGQNLVLASVREFVFYDPAGSSVGGNFSGDVTISLPYPDVDSDGIVDGTSPPLDVASMEVYTLDESLSRWTLVGRPVVDTAAKTASIGVRHFSLYAVGGAASSIGFDELRVYPNPFKPGSANPNEGRPCGQNSCAAGQGITFDNLPADVSITIYDLAGTEIDAMRTFNSGGVVRWDGRNKNGADAATGGYFAVIESPGRKIVVWKLAIIR
ncbi:MAG: fibronectin type III domain-containing protein [Elusimicrobia bacterium]|nr:fibronectin type III domain-containing protein [Elusimicrobiota bacterium]